MTTRSDLRRDEGAVLPLVLVMAVVMSLIVIPTLGYASTVLRANSVVQERARDMEAARAGARIAMADPFDVFNRCKPGSTFITTSDVNGPSTTICNQVSETGLIPTAEKHRGTVATQLDESTPVNALDPQSAAAADPVDWWAADATAQPTIGKIWTPALPPKPSVVSDPAGYYLGDPYYCTVYFPGHFDQPIVLDDRTYFASGVYYFEDTLTVVGGADVTVGMGIHDGCTDDYDVASLIEPLEPLPSGGGGTFVFGAEGRLIVDDSLATDGAGNLVANAANAPLRLQFNQRYVQESWQPEARVSIMSANGDIDATPGPPATAGPLEVANVINMPLSDVSTSTGLVDAVAQGYVPSTLTAEPRPPEPPTGLVAIALRDAAAPMGQRAVFSISWDVPAPEDMGGAIIDEYVVSIEPGGHTCVTQGATSCQIGGLAKNTNYTFTVTAENSVGVSDPSGAVSETSADGSPQVALPAAPVNVTFDEYDDAAEIRWDPPPDDGGLPILGYEVTAYRAFAATPIPVVEQREDQPTTCSTHGHRDDPVPTKCVIAGLADLPPQDGLLNYNISWRFEVRAITVIGESVASDPTSMDDLALDGAAPPGPDPIIVPVATTYIPDPIVDIDTSGAASATVEFAGYISVPQGRVAVERSTDSVLLRGGVLAGSYDVEADVATQPGTTIGFENVTLQRVLQMVTTSGRSTSTMTIQINENGEYAVNSWVIS